MQLKVTKSDGTVEEYLHTKVFGAFNNALALIEQSNVFAAEQFAEAITFYLYQKRGLDTVASDELHLMVQAVLTATGYENAAKAINEFQLNRRLRRARIEIVNDGYGETDDQAMTVSQWTKSQIVADLMKKHHLNQHIARAIGSTVEEKVLNIGMTKIKRSLIKHIVFADMEMILKAQQQLQAVDV